MNNSDREIQKKCHLRVAFLFNFFSFSYIQDQEIFRKFIYQLISITNPQFRAT